MTAMPYNLQGKVVVEVSGISQISSKWENIEEKGNRFSINSSSKSSACSSIDSEPTSILDTRRNPSSPTSSSTLSSFNGGGGGGSGAAGDNRAGVVALSENNNSSSQCPISLPEPTSGGARKEDWAADLQNLHNGSDIVSGCSATGGRGGCVGGEGLGLGDFESMFHGGDGCLVPWIVGEAEEFGGLGLNLKHLLPPGNHPLDYSAGIGVVDQSCSGMDGVATAGISCDGSLMATLSSNLGFHGSGFLHAGKLGSISPTCSSSAVADCKVSYNPQSNSFTPLSNNLPIPVSLQAGLVLHQHQHQHQLDVGDEKPPVFSPQFLINQQQAQRVQSSTLLLPSLDYCQLEQNVAQPHAKRHSPGPFLNQGNEFSLRKQQQELEMQQQFPVALGHHLVHQPNPKQMMVSKQKGAGMGNEMVQQQQQQQHYQLQQHQQLQEQAARDLLHKAVDLIQTGNFSHAQEILARLNHQLPAPAKPLIRVALCVKEALQLLLLMGGNPVAVPPPKCLSPVDVVHKMNAYKVLSEVSPFMQFVNFTCTQAILEELEDAESIHIMDFDIGCGAKWASFIQELPLRKRRARSLKITAFASFSIYHQLELALMHENLLQFANDLGISLDLQVVNFDSFDPSNSTMPSFRAAASENNESIAVYFPIWASSCRPYLFQPLLRFIRQQSPKIMVSLDRGCDRCDLPFSQHLLHALDSCTNLLESLDSLNVPSDIVNKTVKFFVQPTIENTMLGRLHLTDKMIPPWKNLIAASGFLPCSFSNLTETQADYVVKRTPGRGFRVDKRQGSLVLSWQGRELVAASTWKC
ncbi:hypothetical protein Dimus_008926 [Dionaea muscipula]